jgi:hypothetical protein
VAGCPELNRLPMPKLRQRRSPINSSDKTSNVLSVRFEQCEIVTLTYLDSLYNPRVKHLSNSKLAAYFQVVPVEHPSLGQMCKSTFHATPNSQHVYINSILRSEGRFASDRDNAGK